MRILVPTMGALHAGHAELIRRAAAISDEVIVSVFVNPLQFGPHEDFARYPRRPDDDRRIALAAGARHIFAPTPAEMYPDGFATAVQVGPIGEILEGAARPGHFSGVATVVLKLLLHTGADVLVLGEKDYQQVCVLRQMCRDFGVKTQVLTVPTVREVDGLALSSRNAYLSPEARRQAPALHAQLQRAADALRAGDDPETVCAAAVQNLCDAGFATPDYLQPMSADLSQQGVFAGGRLLAAARLEGVRLLDNVVI